MHLVFVSIQRSEHLKNVDFMLKERSQPVTSRKRRDMIRTSTAVPLILHFRQI